MYIAEMQILERLIAIIKIFFEEEIGKVTSV